MAERQVERFVQVAAGEDWGPGGLEWVAHSYYRIIRNYRARPATLAAVLEVAGYDTSVR